MSLLSVIEGIADALDLADVLVWLWRKARWLLWLLLLAGAGALGWLHWG
ncbi:hypothetical protein GTZ99_07835 [Novosphingobium sp. FSY-8]|uniref:Uncharacterized protein n=1 Tax=Novosphingobium ovatum TaxID=1908523 RepID=A0ABW9XD53_9SPHN|nr:hypothetical protein [Novosphingobium ovatum]NBC36463.1 hypothetical protein [Novosphingobium ovatum]